MQVAVSTDPTARDLGGGFTRSILENGNGESPQVAAAGDDVYVAWRDPAQPEDDTLLQLASSRNDGASFRPA